MKRMNTFFLLLLTFTLITGIFSTDAIAGKAEDALKKGEKLIEEKKTEEAIKEFRLAVVYSPDGKTGARAQYLIASYSGDIFTKIMEFKNLIKKYPESGLIEEAYIELGRLYYILDKYPDSEKYFLDYIEKFKETGKYISEAYYWQAQIYLINKNYSKAVEYYVTVVNDYPSSDFALFAKLQLALTYIKQGKYLEARQILEKIWLLNDNFKGIIDEYLDLIPESENTEIKLAPDTRVEPEKIYGIQCGAFKNRDNAFRLKEDLSKKGYGEVFVKKDSELYKVIIGYFSSLEETNKLSREISEKEKIRVAIIKKK